MLNQYTNKHLVEVTLNFQFLEDIPQWDSTYFGQYYDKIKEFGFTEKTENKGIQFTFKNVGQGQVTSSPIEDQVIFRNNSKGWAIVMSKNKLSFHVVNNYTNWQDFISNFVKPYFDKYCELELETKEIKCSLVYLNKFNKPKDERLSDYFDFVKDFPSNLGSQKTIVLQRVFETETNLLITKFNSQLQDENYNINFECGAISKKIALNCDNWVDQANETHMPVRNFFESLITEKLRKTL